MMVPIHALQWYRFADTVTKILFFLETTKKIERNLQLISKLLQKAANYKLLFPGGPSPHKSGADRFGPPTLERSGSEHQRAVTSSLFGQERGLVRDVEPSLMVKKDGMILGKRHYLSLYIFS